MCVTCCSIIHMCGEIYLNTYMCLQLCLFFWFEPLYIILFIYLFLVMCRHLCLCVPHGRKPPHPQAVPSLDLVFSTG